MNRVKLGGYGELIALARRQIPKRIDERLDPYWFCGTDPVFAGLHAHVDADDGRSYRDTAHVSYTHNMLGPRDRRHTTVVLPERPGRGLNWFVVVHELGHVLHERLGWKPSAAPVSAYAARDHWEAFAEAFAYWVVGPEQPPSVRGAYERIDPET